MSELRSTVRENVWPFPIGKWFFFQYWVVNDWSNDQIDLFDQIEQNEEIEQNKQNKKNE